MMGPDGNLYIASTGHTGIGGLDTFRVTGAEMTAREYGETKLVNGCNNGIKCTEDEHQQNRRMEIQILENSIAGEN